MTPPILEVVILAAGQGTRMRSDLPKVLHRLAGRTLIEHVVGAAQSLDARAIHVVYGHGGERVPEALSALPVGWVRQPERLGTGHAVQQAMPGVADNAIVLVLYGDVPLITLESLRPLIQAAGKGSLALLTADLDEPDGYGRVLRDANGKVQAIVEEKDATPAQRSTREINTGMLAAPAKRMRDWLGRLRNDNAAREYYLTDVIALAVSDRVAVETFRANAPWEVLGVNSRAQLAELERIHQRNQAHALMDAGVTLRDPARFDLRGTLACGRDVEIDVNVVIEGKVTLGDRVRIGRNNYIRDCMIGADTEIFPNCVLEEGVVGAHCRLGPYTRMRPANRISDYVHLGNFVEIKKSEIGEGSKVNHLSYIGDTTVGKKVNIGAGTITCNYDGANKHQTVIGDNAFIGSDTQLIAPVKVGEGATIGAGSTITRDAPPGELTLSRAQQTTITGWKRPVKKSK
jgi:bifunctional UDP-N-acetylglucosamine pyrophosphorylase/glucosamine-1-phosphate N-acetyltransferase